MVYYHIIEYDMYRYLCVYTYIYIYTYRERDVYKRCPQLPAAPPS